MVHASTIGTPVRLGERVQGRLLCEDRFGNLLTNIERKGLQGRIKRVGVGERELPWVETYGLAESDKLVALYGSAGRLELARPNGSAALELVNWRELSVWVELESSD